MVILGTTSSEMTQGEGLLMRTLVKPHIASLIETILNPPQGNVVAMRLIAGGSQKGSRGPPNAIAIPPFPGGLIRTRPPYTGIIITGKNRCFGAKPPAKPRLKRGSVGHGSFRGRLGSRGRLRPSYGHGRMAAAPLKGR